MSENDDFNLQVFLPYLLNQAAEESSIAFTQVYKNKYGMLRTEWRVLFHLGSFGKLNATEIGARSKIHKTKISRAVQKLVEKRFVVRERSEDDRRQEFLTLTSAGQTAYADLRNVARDYDAALCDKFSEDEVLLLRKMLRRLAAME
ncbi:MarR family winged helix-turn-helix transcriptional regulator [Shimia thalassica]|jgi:DNA-binding MarR family transcriptional regulator|uniref:Homoprotocatechuate degradation operon regulator, HpaR n=1 Tax=Shimia thalassica TaxID=1715693 RepID=A0A0N7M9V3_9RHOB|nr:MarR family winged helix-turn-helix transcriptional regulator [Shimia thalassica]PHO04575.1 MarR family transcriptional regulator [Rhodobacteraceae bacterium 4F10]MBU2943447.1 MarR family winged helix-turn-helix transcriptional regulator [Shimia thalassica]MDO6478749.1 MarR family winged helix-turn-helix transcriptional regulator [Shimia thalassica]MDO6484527.1 MarR family winged helix-turn-helix transcriptional regulator [Shimia thalassica]MDO6501517.1 MarR family winged helix-turn-helix t